jgi:GTPase SAR1 family protein
MCDEVHPKREWAAADYTDARSALAGLYAKRVAAREKHSLYNDYVAAPLYESEVKAKPQVLLVGQYSTGKTTFLQYLLGGVDFPGIHVGPEPTTDGFMAICGGDTTRLVPGTTATADNNSPYAGLTTFGAAFLQRFGVSEVSTKECPLLGDIAFVDTPGILAGAKQKERSYDFLEAVRWFADKADQILLLFDGHKVDISDEFKEVILALQPHDDKVRLVLNKADLVTTEELMHCYGGVMWFLGKVFKTPEVKRCYTSSFWDQEMKNPELQRFMEAERSKLLHDLAVLPEGALNRKVNDFVRRLRHGRAHMLTLDYLRRNTPLMGKQAAMERMREELGLYSSRIAKESGVPLSDFIDVATYEQYWAKHGDVDFASLPAASDKLRAAWDDIIERCTPHLLNHFKSEMGFQETAADRMALAKKKGYLLKQASTSRTKWQKRYFVLDNSELSYYGTQEDAAQSVEPKGTMILESCTATAAIELEHSYAIKLVTADRNYFLAADSAEDMSAWLKSFQAVSSPDDDTRELVRKMQEMNTAAGAGSSTAFKG